LEDDYITAWSRGLHGQPSSSSPTSNNNMSQHQKTVIIGAGPVGALAALYAAQRGHNVEVYELRNGTFFLLPTQALDHEDESEIMLTRADLRDPSTIPLNFTKSINLALSERGINAMKNSGPLGTDSLCSAPLENTSLLDGVFTETIPVRGRMIHGKTASGELFEQAQDYDIHGRVWISPVLLSVDCVIWIYYILMREIWSREPNSGLKT
jgi:kynurenine 3-monooxygenase